MPGSPPGDLRWVAAVGAVAAAVILVFGLIPRLTSEQQRKPAAADAVAVSSSARSVALGESAIVVPRPTGQPLRVAFIGDSLTVGLSATVSGRTFRQLIINSWGGNDRVRADESRGAV